MNYLFIRRKFRFLRNKKRQKTKKCALFSKKDASFNFIDWYSRSRVGAKSKWSVLLISRRIIVGTVTHLGYLTDRLRGRKQFAFPSDSSATGSISVASLKRTIEQVEDWRCRKEEETERNISRAAYHSRASNRFTMANKHNERHRYLFYYIYINTKAFRQ